jgi:adenosylhomocysteine nucleosidase
MIYLLVALPAEFPEEIKLSENVKLVYSGVGKINAAYWTMKVLQKNDVEKIVNFGTVGAINKKLSGLIIPNKIIQRDMIAEPQAPRGNTPFENEKLSHEIYLETLDKTHITLGTGDSFVTEHDPLFKEKKIDVVDMEAYAIAKICKLEKVPFECYKYVSDFADDNANETWDKNVSKGYEIFLDTFLK